MPTTDERLQVVTTALEIGISKAALLYGFDRKTIGIWISRFKADGLVGLANSCKKNYNNPDSLPADIVNKIINLKKEQPRLSANQIKQLLKLDCSITAINKKIRQSGLRAENRLPMADLKSMEYFLTVRSVNDLFDYKYFMCITHFLTGLVFPGYVRENNLNSIELFLKAFQRCFNNSDKKIIYGVAINVQVSLI